LLYVSCEEFIPLHLPSYPIVFKINLMENVLFQMDNIPLGGEYEQHPPDDEISHKFGWSRGTVKQIRDKHHDLMHDGEIADRSAKKLNDYRRAREALRIPN
ncbi:MAG: hypothetical protein WC043_07445, partial [Pseudobdellovibrionaceae bacterium]